MSKHLIDMNESPRINRWAWTVLAAVAGLGACEHSDPPPQPRAQGSEMRQPAPTVPAGSERTVVERLAEARCNREESCQNVGAGRRYASREVCLDQMRGSIGNDINADSCPHGVDAEALDRCAAAIQGEECNHPFDTIARIDHCRGGALCWK